MDTVERFERMLAAGRESPLLRLTLGTEYLQREDPGTAIGHLARAVDLDPDYSAAWQHLGRAFEQAERMEEAASAWRSGIDAADRRGDAQAAKVMRVWLRRLERRSAAAESPPAEGS